MLPDWRLLALFGAGAFVMRGAGCIVNDMWDRDFDRRVARTRERPLASGAVSLRGASALLAGHLAAGLAIVSQLNTPTIAAAFAAVPVAALYPLLKRVTNWPQLGLGLAFNWGALIGGLAVTGTFEPHVALPLYLGGVAWTVVYDTIYASQDAKDDRALGLGSTALRFGARTKHWLAGFSALSVAGVAAAGVNAGLGLQFAAVSVVGGAAHFAWQLRSVRLASRADCWRVFDSNKWLGALVFAGIALDRYLAF
jgi:4-hydroxybenzoate polyprenyltransferase